MLAKWWMVGDGLAAEWFGVGWAVWKAAAKYSRNIEEREAERWMVDADGGISEADSVRRIVEGG